MIARSCNLVRRCNLPDPDPRCLDPPSSGMISPSAWRSDSPSKSLIHRPHCSICQTKSSANSAVIRRGSPTRPRSRTVEESESSLSSLTNRTQSREARNPEGTNPNQHNSFPKKEKQPIPQGAPRRTEGAPLAHWVSRPEGPTPSLDRENRPERPAPHRALQAQRIEPNPGGP
jgi:hypothetical protein